MSVTFRNTDLTAEISLLAFVNSQRINSASRCKPCAKQVKWSIFGNKTCSERIALSM